MNTGAAVGQLEPGCGFVFKMHFWGLKKDSFRNPVSADTESTTRMSGEPVGNMQT
jgi:hypothetical protein